jgi:hypothetical protein
MPRDSLTNGLRRVMVCALSVAELLLAIAGTRLHAADLIATAVLAHLWKREIQQTEGGK